MTDSIATVESSQLENEDGLGRLFTKTEIVELSELNPVAVVRDLGLVWMAIAATLTVAVSQDSVAGYIVGFLVMGVLQNNLIAWTHEASHYGLMRSKKRNDLLADLLICGPLGTTVSSYRNLHFKHHRALGDPNVEVDLSAWICVRGGSLFAEIAKHLSGVYVYKLYLRYARAYQSSGDDKVIRSIASVFSFSVFNGFLLWALYDAGIWYAYFLLWILPLFTLALLLTNFRTLVEHQPSSDVCDRGLVQLPAITRRIRTHLLERWLVAPVGFYYHVDHHLAPCVPYSKLPRFRSILEDRGYFDQPEIVQSEGYVRTIWRLAKSRDFGVRVPDPASPRS